MKQAMQKKIRVAVLCGGMSSERDVSIQTGRQVAGALSTDRYTVSIVSIDAEGQWFFESDTLSSEKKHATDALSLSEIVDVVFIALHGKFGEDGTIQAILEKVNIPYTGSGVVASALGMDKSKCSEAVKNVSVPVPEFFLARKKDDTRLVLENIENTFGFPCFVKPNASGSSVGVSIVHRVSDVSVAIEKAWREDETAIVQQYIPGREFSCGVMGNTEQMEIEALPVVEITPKSSEFFDYGAKYTPNASEEVCPALLPKEVTASIQKFSILAHTTLGCDGLTRSDFRLDPEGNIFFLEINTIPGQTKTSLCPKEATAAGMTFPKFLEKQILLALRKKSKPHSPDFKFEKELIRIAKSKLKFHDPSHDISHALRVMSLARTIAKAEKADRDIVIPAALFHDIVNYPKDHPKRHFSSDESAKLVEVILKNLKTYPKEKIKKVCESIRQCSFSKGISHDFIEAKVLQDADSLEATGAISIMRTFASAGSMGRRFYSETDPFCETRSPDDSRFALDLFFSRLLKVQDRLYTKTAQKIAKRRTLFLKKFIDSLKKDLGESQL